MLAALIVGGATADTGHWTTKANWSRGNQERYAVHMMLLRGDSTYHSRILWWQGEGQVAPSTTTLFYGGEWGWRSAPDTAVVLYPTANFDTIHVDTCGMDPFCGSHAILGDGRVLQAGGHNPFIMDYGDNRARIFTDGTGSSPGAWSEAHDMNYWRWYPTATTLRDGRALLTAGEQYRHHQIFGGKRNGSAPSSPSADSLHRFAPIRDGKWDPGIIPDAAPGNQRPTPRYAHSAIFGENIRHSPERSISAAATLPEHKRIPGSCRSSTTICCAAIHSMCGTSRVSAEGLRRNAATTRRSPRSTRR